MKKLYFAVLLTLNVSISFAQTVEIVEVSDLNTDISGTEIERIGTNSDIAIYAELRVINKTGSAINMAFMRRRLINSGQPDQICDNQGCFNAADTYEWTTSPVEIANNDTSLFKPQIVPNGNDFCGLNKYFVVDDQGVVYDSITIKIRTGKEDCFLNVENEAKEVSSFKIYPNPAQNVLYIENLTFSEGRVAIYDALGKEVLNQDLNDEISLASIKNGLYFVHVVNNKGVLSDPKKLIVRK